MRRSRWLPAIVWGFGLVACYLLGRWMVAADRAAERFESRKVSGLAGLTDTKTIRSAFEQRLPSVNDPRAHDEMFDLADAWGAQSPQVAADWLSELDFEDPRNPFLFSALTRWAERDLDKALAWLNAKFPEPGESRDYLLAALVRGAARSDPDAAERLLLSSPNSPERSGAVDFLVHQWRRVGLGHALEKVASFAEAEPRLRQRAIRRAVSDLSGADLALARDWATGLTDAADRLTAIAGIAATWSQSEPAPAAEWAGTLGESKIQRRAFGEVATRWARIDPLAAGSWLAAGAGDPAFDLARRAFAGNTVNYDPEVAFAKVAAIQETALREQSFEQIGRLFLNIQPERARRFFESEGVMPAALRQQLLLSLE